MADLISVVVPVYNVAKELPRCLDSILAQQYSNIEIVAVDDGSSDKSGKILDQYAQKHSNVRVIHKENAGVTSARLRGVADAHGEWIGFVDGDDEIQPEMYERLLQNAAKYHAEISHCGYEMIFPDGRVNYFHNTGLLVQQDKTTALRELLSGERVEPGLCNKLFHKTLFYRLLHDRTMPLDIKINEDLLMNYYLFSAAEQSVFDDWCPYHYIVRKKSASRDKLNLCKIYDPIRVKDIICKIATDDMKSDAQRAYLNTCINTYHMLLYAGKEFQKDLQRVRVQLIKKKYFFCLLGRKRALMARLITRTPFVYKFIYSFYCRFFQKSMYS